MSPSVPICVSCGNPVQTSTWLGEIWPDRVMRGKAILLSQTSIGTIDNPKGGGGGGQDLNRHQLHVITLNSPPEGNTYRSLNATVAQPNYCCSELIL